ncbi:MAG: M20/M25/M40 family metallo-hydrolase [Mediterranea sp.]|jgi:Zn-dependent M28 family amino/carboxypeptidase|nr:M20/M25/M40 family metallo-hydrolase [Mediterranea sp.]
MKRNYLIASLFVCLSTTLLAQKAINKGLESISRQGVEAHLAFLASDVLEGREAGKRGGQIASEYLKAVLQELGIAPLDTSYFQAFEAYSLERQEKSRFQVNVDSIAKYKQKSIYRKLTLRNVLGYIEGRKKNEYVVVGAHFDHLGIDEFLVGDKIYNGADDNASSVAAVLQVAKAYVASEEKPLRSIIFAFWDGEELGCLGSEFFLSRFEPVATIKGYINLDMVGRNGTFPAFLPRNPDANHAEKKEIDISRSFFFFYTDTFTKFNDLLVKDIETYQLSIIPQPRVLSAKARGSDNSSFSDKKIPVLWYFTGVHPDYHTPSDEIDKINLDKLTNLSKATYLSLQRLANDD